MPSIIAATDFSHVADNAIRYACDMAKSIDATVTIVHSFIIPVAFSDTTMPVMPIDEGVSIAEDRMKEIINDIQTDYPNLHIKSKILYGDLVDSLQEYVEEENEHPMAIVVGNSGSGNSALWLGSTVLSALKQLPFTVIAVPEESKYRNIQNICFAIDLQHIPENLPLNQLHQLTELTKASLHVLNINTKPENAIFFEDTSLPDMLESLSPHYHHYQAENLDQEIQEFIVREHMDWLIILPLKHPFFEGLFHKSHTKAVVKAAHIPVVALHS